MKNVLIYRRRLLPYSETFIKAQAESLTEWEYTFLGRELCDDLPIDKTKVRLFPSAGKGFFNKLASLFSQSVKKQTEQFIESLRAEAFDVFHVHFATDAVNVAYIAEALNIPMVVTLHGFDINTYKEFWESGSKGDKKKQYPQRLLALAQRPNIYFIAVSEAIKQRAIEFGIPEHLITVKYIGIDLSKFKAPNYNLESQNILFVGRMVEKKGAQVLIKAFAKVHANMPSARLTMVGDGEQLLSNQQLAKELSVPVEFVGAKSSDEVVAYLNNSRVFCLPSITAASGDAEGMGMVILEAQACGVPVVTSARGGATEGIVHGETGFAFAEGDVDALSEYLMRVLKDNELACAMSKAGIKLMAERFDIKACTQALEAYYEAIVSKV